MFLGFFPCLARSVLSAQSIGYVFAFWHGGAAGPRTGRGQKWNSQLAFSARSGLLPEATHRYL